MDLQVDSEGVILWPNSATSTDTELHQILSEDINLQIIVIRRNRYRHRTCLLVNPIRVLQFVDQFIDLLHIQREVHDETLRWIIGVDPLDLVVVLQFWKLEPAGDPGVDALWVPIGLGGARLLGVDGIAVNIAEVAAAAIDAGAIAVVAVGFENVLVLFAFAGLHSVLNQFELEIPAEIIVLIVNFEFYLGV